MTPRARAVALGITVVCLLLIARQVRRRQMRASYLVLWTSLCLVAIPLIAVPNGIETVSSWLGIYYPPATIFLLAIFVLFMISIHFSRQLTRLEERTRVLAEELSLLRLESSGHDPAPASDEVAAEFRATLVEVGAAAGSARARTPPG
jgi:hypothetical protein